MAGGGLRPPPSPKLERRTNQPASFPSWDEVARLAAIAAIRTFLNYFLERAIWARSGLGRDWRQAIATGWEVAEAASHQAVRGIPEPGGRLDPSDSATLERLAAFKRDVAMVRDRAN